MVNAKSLQTIPFFQGFSQSDLEAIASLMVERSFQPGQLLFLEGETNTGLWFVARGRVKIYRLAPLGKEQILCLMGAGTCFGGCPLFDGDHYPATAQAVSDVTLYILPRAEALYMARQNPAVARALLHVFAERLHYLSCLAEGLTFRCVTGRLSGLLLDWAAEQGAANEPDRPLRLSLTQNDLAALLGTTPQMVSRALLRLERLGAIAAYGRRVTILNRTLLQQLAAKV